jgi:hypothetical protein
MYTIASIHKVTGKRTSGIVAPTSYRDLAMHYVKAWNKLKGDFKYVLTTETGRV